MMRSTILRPWAVGTALLLAAGCAEESTAPTEAERQADAPAPAFAALLTCTVQVGEAGGMDCEPAAGPGTAALAAALAAGSTTGMATATASGGPKLDLIVGSQHQFVRLANTTPTVASDVWSADVTVQNLTFQPMATLDGGTPEAEGVRVFFVDEPNNDVVVVSNHDGTAVFTGSEPQKYYQYAGADLGGDGILTSGETSAPKTWEFTLNGASTFQFGVLVSASVPDESAYGVHLERVEAGGFHTCGDGSDGNVYCWGFNGDGQLGDGTNTERHTPTPVAGGVTLSNVTAGGFHTCALGSDGNAYCWGSNGLGQLGNGTTTEYHTPTPVVGGVALSNVTAGTAHTCGDGSDGKVYCWGRNGDGQLGDGGVASPRSLTPVQVIAPAVGVTLSNVTAGEFHTCADGSNEKVYCWGRNDFGQLGNGTTDPALAPFEVTAPAVGVTLSNVTAGRRHTCGDGSDGKVYCWGRNGEGQLGDGTTTPAPTPVEVIAPAVGVTLSNVTAGSGQTCAEGSDGKVYCWGYNGGGQLGDGTTTNRTTPVAVSAPAGVTLSNVTAGGDQTCAEGSDGNAYCWGFNGNGRLGDGTTTTRPTPVIVAGT